MQAHRIETQTLPPPPGIIGSLRTGFDAIAGNVTAILMPLLLDLLLWLGPHLSVERLLNSMYSAWVKMLPGMGAKPDALQTLQGNWDAFQPPLHAFNVLGILRTFPIGVSSLMSGTMPTSTPWGLPRIVDVASLSQLVGLGVLVILGGWVGGGIYFRWVAALATPGLAAENYPGAVQAVVQSVIYAAVWFTIGCVVGVPVSILLSILTAVNGALAQGVLVLLVFLSMWLIVPVFFSPHGIFVRKQTALASIVSGFELSRFTLPTSSLFVLVVLSVGVGFNILLWSKPAADSWLVLVGIFGHAFITTALLASSFVYYNNMSVWLQSALARLRAGLPGQQAS